MTITTIFSSWIREIFIRYNAVHCEYDYLWIKSEHYNGYNWYGEDESCG